MPNWCENEIQVSGDVNELERLSKFAYLDRYHEFDFDKILPTPREYLDDNRWYDWRIENWGTKWEADCATVSFTNDEKYPLVEITFNTAWSPSIPLTIKLSEIFPLLRFEHLYQEGGMDFGGRIIIENGEVISEEYGSYGDFMEGYDEEDDEDEEE